MTDKKAFNFPPGMLICPVCATELEGQVCNNCRSEFFELGNIPCVFTSGVQQKKLWQHQMAMMEAQGGEALENLDYTLQGYDLSALTRDRLEQAYESMEQSLNVILAQFSESGLVAELDPMYEQNTVDNPTEYYHHILRDWAWDNEPSKYFETHANDANLNRVLNIWSDPKPGKMLVLGAGAGRLSWDLHERLAPEFTIASDLNPFLLTCAQDLIKERKVITLPELYTYPQIGYPFNKPWVMQPPKDENNARANWYALGSDVWNMPLRENSVDTIVTSWLLDVTGGDVKDLIGVITYLLKPGGRWINTGPLLYSRTMPFDKKYSAEEILDFAEMSGFEVEQQSVDEVEHMVSPLNARYHYEQIFSFNAKKLEKARPLPKPGNTSAWLTPGWLVMHHLPVPKIDFQCERGHEFIGKVLDLVDGEKSIYLMAQLLQAEMPEGVSAKDAVTALFGQILEQMAKAADSAAH
ncbi:MAG TPA: hypothetical protein VIC26_12840 [Marinagarivorans sp.]